MGKRTHNLYILTMVAIGVLTTMYLTYTGFSYYNTSLEERFYHPHHNWFKPSGPYGHGLGILGTFMILFGVTIYIARKRYNFLSRFLRLKYLLEFHIFLCCVGPVLILFHTTFKFGGIVSIAFWSMVAVVLSGVLGRYIYMQIPRTIEGRELSLNEVKDMKTSLINTLTANPNVDPDTIQMVISSTDERAHSDGKSSLISRFFQDKKTVRLLIRKLKLKKLSLKERAPIVDMVKNEISLSRKIKRLQTMQKLFRYWHVAHLPFALIMLIIVLIHIGVTLVFGYKWIL